MAGAEVYLHCTPSFTLIHPTVWPQYANVTDRETDRHDGQPEPFPRKDSLSHMIISSRSFHLCNTITKSISGFCFLDLSATFDHNISITRLSSRFGTHGSVLKWLLFCYFEFELTISRPSISQGFVLGPRLFIILYSTQCCHLLSFCEPSALSSHTQFLFSFHPPNFDTSMSKKMLLNRSLPE